MQTCVKPVCLLEALLHGLSPHRRRRSNAKLLLKIVLLNVLKLLVDMYTQFRHVMVRIMTMMIIIIITVINVMTTMIMTTHDMFSMLMHVTLHNLAALLSHMPNPSTDRKAAALKASS